MKTFGAYLASLGGRSPLRRGAVLLLRYCALLVAVVLLYGWLFHVLMAREGQDHSWFTGVYWALTVMSTLGYGDITFTTDLGRGFSTIVLLTGLVLLLIMLPFLFVSLVYAPWLDRQNRRRALALRRVPDDVKGHVLICADDPIALGLVHRLALSNVPAWIVEPDPVKAAAMHDAGTPVLVGEVDGVDTYAAGHVQHARLVLANASDTVNTNIVLTVRELSESVPIVAIAEFDDSVDILELSGATHVLPLKHQLGEQLAGRVSAGATRANVIGRFHDLLLAEFPVHDTPLQGKTIRETGLREYIGVTVVAVWDRGQLRPAAPDMNLSPTCVPVVIGTAEQIGELDEMLVIYDAKPRPVLVIGGGKVGRAATAALKRREIGVHLVEKDPALEPQLTGLADELFFGDAADRRVLERAGIHDAPSVLLTTHDDAVNVYLTVYCRRLNPKTRILTRVTYERNVEAIVRAGADVVLSYASLGVNTVFALAQGRELVLVGAGLDLFHLPVPKQLVGRTLADAAIAARTGLNVIAVRENGQTFANPAADTALAADAVLLALGNAQQRRAFNAEYG